MRQNLTPVVLVLAALVLGVLVYRDRVAPSDAERALRKDALFPAWRRDRVTALTLRGPGGEVRLDRAPATQTWTIHGSTEAPDAARADVLFAELEAAVALRSVDKDATMGLASPRVTGEITMGDVVYRFALGGAAPKPEGAAYLEVVGVGTFVVEKRLAVALLADVSEYRDKRLVPQPLASPDRAHVVATSGGAFDLVRSGRVRHTLGDSGPYASRAEVTAFLAALADLSVTKSLAPTEAAANASSGAPFLTLRADTSEATFVVGGPCPGAPDDVIVARRAEPPMAGCVPAGVVATLRRPRGTYADGRVFFVRIDELEEVRIERPGSAPFDVARKGSGFRVRSPRERDLEGDASDGLRAFLGRLLDLGGVAVDGVKGEEISKVRVVYGKVTEEVRFVRDTSGSVVAARTDGKGLSLPAGAERFVSPPEALDRPLAIFPRDRALEGLRLACGGLVQDIVRRGGLTLSAPAPFPLDVALASQAMTTAQGARADVWVSDRRDGLVPPASPCTITARFEGDAGPRELTLELSPPEAETVYGSFRGEGAVLVVPRELARLVVRPLVSREGFAVDEDRAETLEVTTGLGARRLSLGGDGGVGSAARRALGGLRPLFAVRRGPLGDGERDPARTEIAVTVASDAGPPRTVRYRFGKVMAAPEGKVVYAERDGSGYVFAVREGPVAELRAFVETPP